MAKFEVTELARVGERSAGERAAGLDRIANRRIVERGIVLGIERLASGIWVAQRSLVVRGRDTNDVIAVVLVGGVVVIERLAFGPACVELGERRRLELDESAKRVWSLEVEIAQVVERVI